MPARRVLLLLPPSALEPPGARPLHAPLFSALMAAALRGDGHAVQVIDAHLGRPDLGAALRAAEAFGPDRLLLVHSDYNRQVPAPVLRAAAAGLRRALPGRPLALAGRLSEAVARAALRENIDVDGVLIGEPEAAACAWAPEGAGPLLRSSAGPLPRPAPPRPPPVPAWDLVPLRAYAYAPHQATAAPVVPVLASRGCPHPCYWCEVRDQGPYQRRPVAEVLEELRVLQARDNVQSVFFADPTFGVDARWLEALLAGLRAGPPLRWSCMMRPDQVSAPQLRAMRAAGCWSVLYGVESLNPAAQRQSGKGLEIGAVVGAIAAAQAAGLEVIASAVIGLVGDDPAGFRATVEALVRAGPDYAQFFPLRVPPHRALPPGARRVGEIRGARHDFTGQLALGPGFSGEAEVEALRRWAFRRFYLRPGYAAGLLRRRLADGRAVETAARLSRGGLLALRMSLPGAAP